MKHWKLTVIIVILAIILPISGVFLYSNFSAAQNEEEIVAEEAAVSPTAMPIAVTLTEWLDTASQTSGLINIRGKIVSDGNVKLTATAAATVKEILFTQGEQVQKGDILIRMGGDNEAKHNLEFAYEQALLNQVNLKKTLANTQTATAILVKQAEQQGRSLDVTLDQLNTTLNLTKNAGQYTAQGAEIGLNNLQNSLNRAQSLRNSNAGQLDLTGDQAQEMAAIQARNTAISMLTTLQGAYQPLVAGIANLSEDHNFEEYENDLDDIIADLKEYDTHSTSRISDRLGSLNAVLYDLLDVNTKLAEDAAMITNPTVKPLATSLSQVSNALTNAVTVAISQLGNTKNQLEALPTTTAIQLQNLDSQIAGISDQVRSLQTTIEQARNGAELQVQGINAQIQGVKQQKVSANLALESARAAAKTQLDTLNGQLDLVNKQVEQAKNALDQLTIISPIDGYIVDVPVSVGESVGIGRELATVYATNILFVRASIAPADRENIQVGEVADLSVSTTTSTGKVGAKVMRIAPVADANGLIPVDLAFTAEELPVSFVPGVSLQGQISRKVNTFVRVERVMIPISAVRLDGGKAYVFVYQSGQVKQTEVTLGPSENGLVTITRGVTNTDRIVTSDISKLDDGVEVTPNNE